jgi:hypothetical protein
LNTREMPEKTTTHFGYQEVPEEEKARKVGGVFSSVAPSYDLMNDLMSLGLHRAWKRFALEMSGVRAGMRVLDVASGSGDLAAAFARRVGSLGRSVDDRISTRRCSGSGATSSSTAASSRPSRSATRRSSRSATRASTVSPSPSAFGT